MKIYKKWIGPFGEYDIPQNVLECAEKITPGVVDGMGTIESFASYVNSEGYLFIQRWGMARDTIEAVEYEAARLIIRDE